MFIVSNYQISFVKFYSLILSKNRGRFDTICRIQNINTKENHFLPTYRGKAYLNPKDNPNKIIGKKIALTRALVSMKADKYLRTIIWKAFWNWIESWKTNNNPACFGEPIQESENAIIVPASINV